MSEKNSLMSRRNFAKAAGLTAAGSLAVVPAAQAASIGSIKSLLGGKTTTPEPEPEPEPVKIDYKKLYMKHMDSVGIKYTDVDDFVVRVSYYCDNMDSIDVYVLFNDEGKNLVKLVSWTILTATTDDALAGGILACNEMNNTYRWTKFYIDSDNDLDAQIDCIVDEYTVGEELVDLVERIVSIADDAYPTFAAAMKGKTLA